MHVDEIHCNSIDLSVCLPVILSVSRSFSQSVRQAGRQLVSQPASQPVPVGMRTHACKSRDMCNPVCMHVIENLYGCTDAVYMVHVHYCRICIGQFLRTR